MPHAVSPYLSVTDICDVQMGLSVRGRLETGVEGKTPVITLRDTSEGWVDVDMLQRADLLDVDPRYFVMPGDLIFRTRFEPNVTIHLTEVPEGVVLMAPLVLLRVRRAEVDPAYVSWWINQAPAQAHIGRGARGSNLRMIPRKVVDTIEVPIPDIETQRKIIEFDRLATAEATLLHSIADKREHMLRAALVQSVMKAQPH